MRRAVVAACLAISLGPAHGEPGSRPSLPWLENLRSVRAVDATAPIAAFALEDHDAEDDCIGGLGATLALHADIAPAAGRETIYASYRGGVVVVGSEGQTIATGPGYDCEGSADGIEILAAGAAFGVPTIVIAATSGGQRERMTWIAMLRPGRNGELDTVFAGAVELVEDGIVRRGGITILPGALLVRDHLGGVGFWTFDPVAGVYVPRGAYGDREPHS